MTDGYYAAEDTKQSYVGTSITKPAPPIVRTVFCLTC